MRQFTAKNNDDGMRLSRFVERVTQGLSGGAMHKAFRNRRIKVNGKRAAAEYRLHEGDSVELYLNDEFFPPQPLAAPQGPEKPRVPFTVEWQNKAIAILYKPAGVLCHSDNTRDGDLAASFAASLYENGEFDPAQENGFSPALCNRLDRGTEGLVLAAKQYPALRDMNAALKAGHVHKTYLCIAAGAPPEGRHEAYILRDKQRKTSRVVAHPAPDAKPIATGVRVLERKAGLSLCEIELYTGRTHQIRAHLHFLGAPLLGDKRYGNAAANRRHPLKTQALCAWKLRFDEQLDGESIASLAGQSVCAQNAALPELWAGLK